MDVRLERREVKSRDTMTGPDWTELDWHLIQSERASGAEDRICPMPDVFSAPPGSMGQYLHFACNVIT